MIDTQLILIEGLPGSGKTSLAEFLSAQLVRRGLPVQCLLETTRPHPLHAAESPHHLEAFARASLQTWQAYAAQASQSGILTIAEGILYQNAVRLLLQNGLQPQRIIALAGAIEEATRPLRPVLINLTQADVSQAVERICQLRGAKFQAYLIQALTENAYARQHGWTGLEGAVGMLRDYRDLCDTLVSRSRLTKLVLETSAGEWSRYAVRAMEFLGLLGRA